MRGGRILVLALLAAARAASGEEEWSRWRGPNGSGVAAGASIPERWTEADLDWKVKLPGAGHSSPVIRGGAIFIASAEDEGRKRHLLRLRAADGAIEWTRSWDSETHPKHARSSYASSSPAADGERVYVASSAPSRYLLKAFLHDGKEAWSRDLGPYKSQHGSGTSPVVAGELVVLAGEQDGESFVVAVDRKTGEVRWRTPRRTEETAYGTPVLIEEKLGTALLLSSHAHGLAALELRSGKPLWEARVFDKRTVSSPVFTHGLALGTCGSGGGGSFLVAVRPGGEGDVTTERVAWKLTQRIPYVPTPVVHGDLLFLWGDMGVVTCVELPAGKVLWQERAGGNYSGSPVVAGGKVYCLSEEGEAVVIAAAREFRLLARNPLGEGSRSTPAVAGGRMFLRTYSHLISVGGKAEKGAGAGGR